MDREIIITILSKGFTVKIGNRNFAKEKKKDVLTLVDGELFD